jgi:hypothetical protein
LKRLDLYFDSPAKFRPRYSIDFFNFLIEKPLPVIAFTDESVKRVAKTQRDGPTFLCVLAPTNCLAGYLPAGLLLEP